MRKLECLVNTGEVNQIIEEVAQEKNINYKKGYGLCNEAFDVYLTSEQLEI